MTQALPPPDAPPIPVLRERDDGSTYWDEIDPIDRAMNANQNLEYVDGRFVEKKVSEASSYLGMAIGTRLNIAADFGRIARVHGSDLEYRVWPERPRHSRRPDASVIRLDRVLELPPNPGTLPIVPDLAVEIISPGDEVREVTEKQEESGRTTTGTSSVQWFPAGIGSARRSSRKLPPAVWHGYQ